MPLATHLQDGSFRTHRIGLRRPEKPFFLPYFAIFYLSLKKKPLTAFLANFGRGLVYLGFGPQGAPDVLHPKLGQKTTFTPILLVTPTFSILQRPLGHI